MNDKVFILTDGCMWEINKKMGDEHPHAVEVVDLETGAVRYIRSGSKIKFVDGFITDIRTQERYNKATEAPPKVPGDKQDKKNGAGRKVIRKKSRSPRPSAGVQMPVLPIVARYSQKALQVSTLKVSEKSTHPRRINV